MCIYRELFPFLVIFSFLARRFFEGNSELESALTFPSRLLLLSAPLLESPKGGWGEDSQKLVFHSLPRTHSLPIFVEDCPSLSLTLSLSLSPSLSLSFLPADSLKGTWIAKQWMHAASFFCFWLDSWMKLRVSRVGCFSSLSLSVRHTRFFFLNGDFFAIGTTCCLEHFCHE